MIILLSPAKTLDFEQANRFDSQDVPIFLDDSQRLVSQLQKYKPKDLRELMGISEALAELNTQRFQHWQLPYPEGQARIAIQAFRGDVYSGLDADTLSEADVQFAQQHVRILSGLYGMLRPLDQMLPYRLEMGTKLKTRRGGNLYQFWGERIGTALNEELQAFESAFVVDLASMEYSKSVNKKTLAAQLITPVFKDEKNGTYKVISFFAKKARGAMARHLVQQRSTSPADIKAFDWQGYRYCEQSSSEAQPVFLRSESAAQRHAQLVV